MVKRVGKLFDRVVSYDNMRTALWKAARGKRDRREVTAIVKRCDAWIAEAIRAIEDGSFPFGKFQQFLIRDPKIRIITAPCFQERVVHHAIMNVCEPIFDRWLIDATYACRVGRGRDLAVRRAVQFARRFDCFVKLDIRKYFDSIPHQRLLELLGRKFKDERLLRLFGSIIRSFRGNLGCGVPIGSLTSQHFANYYLGWFDRFVKEQLRIRGYIRYMDDMILWHTDRKYLRDMTYHCEVFLKESLGLVVKRASIQSSDGGVDFLGCRVFRTHAVLSRRSRVRWRRKLRMLQRAASLGLLTERQVQQRMESATAFVRSAGVKSWLFRTSVLKQLPVGGH